MHTSDGILNQDCIAIFFIRNGWGTHFRPPSLSHQYVIPESGIRFLEVFIFGSLNIHSF